MSGIRPGTAEGVDRSRDGGEADSGAAGAFGGVVEFGRVTMSRYEADCNRGAPMGRLC